MQSDKHILITTFNSKWWFNIVANVWEKYPDRFVGCIMLSMMDIDNAVEEFDRVIKDLGMKWATIPTIINGKGLDRGEFYPIYERIVKYDVPLFLHPIHWKGDTLVKDWKLVFVFGWHFDTTQAV